MFSHWSQRGPQVTVTVVSTIIRLFTVRFKWTVCEVAHGGFTHPEPPSGARWREGRSPRQGLGRGCRGLPDNLAGLRSPGSSWLVRSFRGRCSRKQLDAFWQFFTFPECLHGLGVFLPSANPP